MKGVLKTVLVISILSGIFGLIIWVFMEGREELAMEQERERPIKAPSRVSVKDGETVITIDRETLIKSGITVTPLKMTSHRGGLEAYGMVLELQSLADLRRNIVDLHKNITDSNNNLTAAKAQAERMRVSLEVSVKEYERLKSLNEDNRNISDKSLQSAEAVWHSNEVNYRAAQESLRLAHQSFHNVEESLHAIKDTVRQRWGNIITGWLIESSPSFERLMNQQDVLIQITLPSYINISSLSPTIRAQTVDGGWVDASLVSPAPLTDPRIQGRSFFYLTPAKTTHFIAGMNIKANLPVGPEVQGVICPSSAVVWWQGKEWVYVQRDAGHFVRQEISLESPIEGGWFVVKGLSPGERLVVGGAQMLLSEEFRSQIKVGEEGGKE